mmetsp:Transcript_41582/g.109517  ORF Transcript_41582/g.109517 Transcript_41582/m.109517 type:complete len:476 (-) Transcript_41582:1271-2698(-)
MLYDSRRSDVVNHLGDLLKASGARVVEMAGVRQRLNPLAQGIKLRFSSSPDQAPHVPDHGLPRLPAHGLDAGGLEHPHVHPREDRRAALVQSPVHLRRHRPQRVPRDRRGGAGEDQLQGPALGARGGELADEGGAQRHERLRGLIPHDLAQRLRSQQRQVLPHDVALEYSKCGLIVVEQAHEVQNLVRHLHHGQHIGSSMLHVSLAHHLRVLIHRKHPKSLSSAGRGHGGVRLGFDRPPQKGQRPLHGFQCRLNLRQRKRQHVGLYLHGLAPSLSVQQQRGVPEGEVGVAQEYQQALQPDAQGDRHDLGLGLGLVQVKLLGLERRNGRSNIINRPHVDVPARPQGRPLEGQGGAAVQSGLGPGGRRGQGVGQAQHLNRRLGHHHEPSGLAQGELRLAVEHDLRAHEVPLVEGPALGDGQEPRITRKGIAQIHHRMPAVGNGASDDSHAEAVALPVHPHPVAVRPHHRLRLLRRRR